MFGERGGDDAAARAALEAFGNDIEDWGKVEVLPKCYGATTCRVLAPEIFQEVKIASKPALEGAFAEAGRELRSKSEYQAVRQAIMCCPVKAIRWVRTPNLGREKPPPLFTGFPKQIEDTVFSVGFTGLSTFGAQSYFLRREDGQNMLIDPPNAHPDLVEKLEAMGGVKYLLFTHQDHTANHQAWYDATKAPRLIHKKAIVYYQPPGSPFPDTSMFETQLDLGPLETQLFDGCPDLRIIHTPGHTPGDLCFLYKDKFLFTGDCLAYSPAKGHLHAHRIQCWDNWSLLTRSIDHLQKYDFQWVLPGHGDWYHFDSKDDARTGMRECVSWMETQAPGRTWLPWFILWTQVRSACGKSGRRSKLMYFLADNFMLPSAARQQLPNWVIPAALWWQAVLAPTVSATAIAALWIWKSRKQSAH